MELEFLEIEFHAKKILVWSPHTRFKEPYSGVFKPYSSVFLQFFFNKCDYPILGSGSPIVAFLSPVAALLCKKNFNKLITPYQVQGAL